jgi:hypothetical protein
VLVSDKSLANKLVLFPLDIKAFIINKFSIVELHTEPNIGLLLSMFLTEKPLPSKWL